MSKISVLLLEDVAGLGSAGDIVSVAEGHARNYLFPNGLAAIADESTQQQAAAKTKAEQQQAESELDELQSLASSMEGTEVAFTAKVKEGDDIFGSITAGNVADEINQQTNLKLKAKEVQLSDKITKLGDYTATISLSPDVETTVRVVVTPDPDSTPQNDGE